MELVVYHGSVTVNLTGEGYYVIQISTCVDPYLVIMEDCVSMLLEEGITGVFAKQASLESTVKQKLTTVCHLHANTMEHATMMPMTFAALVNKDGLDPPVK